MLQCRIESPSFLFDFSLARQVSFRNDFPRSFPIRDDDVTLFPSVFAARSVSTQTHISLSSKEVSSELPRTLVNAKIIEIVRSSSLWRADYMWGENLTNSCNKHTAPGVTKKARAGQGCVHITFC